jgi:hypothetical protein
VEQVQLLAFQAHKFNTLAAAVAALVVAHLLMVRVLLAVVMVVTKIIFLDFPQ